MKQTLVLIGVLVVLLSACQSLSEKHQATLLQDTLWRYQATVRWGDLAQAEAFAGAGSNPSRKKFSPDLRVTGYEVVQGPSMIEPDQAVQTVVIEYVFESNQQVRKLIDQQVWLYDSQAESWSRQSPLPEFH